MKKAIKILGVIISVPILLFLITIVVIYIKQENIVQTALSEYNETINGKIKIERSKITPFHNFPYISIDLKNVEVWENKTDKEPILQLQDVYIGFNIIKILKGNYTVSVIELKKGDINIVQYANGDFNFSNAFEGIDATEQDTSQNTISLDLKKVKLYKLNISKNNKGDSTTIIANVKKIITSVKTNKEQIFTSVDGAFTLNILKNGDTTFVKNKNFDLDIALKYNFNDEILKISPSKVKLEKVSFGMEGIVDIKNELDLDIKFRGDKNNFDLLFAFLPEEYIEFAKRYQNSGKIYFDAFIQGKSINGHLPKVEAKFGCANGYFENVNVKRSLDRLNFAGYFTNGNDRTLGSSELILTDFEAHPEQGIVQANLAIRDFTDPSVNLDVYTDFDLNFLADFFQLSYLQNLRGRVELVVNYDELIDITLPETGIRSLKEGVESELRIKNLGFRFPKLPLDFRDINVDASMSDGRLEIEKFTLKVGKSDFQIFGFFSDLPAIFHSFNKEISSSITLKSNYIDLYELTSFDTSKVTPIKEVVENFRVKAGFTSTANNLKDFRYLPIGEFIIEDLYAKLKNYPHTLHDFDAHIYVTENDLVVNHFKGEIDKSDITISGKVYNYPKWMKDKTVGKSYIDFKIKSNRLIPNDLLTYKGENYLPKDYREEDIYNLILDGKVDLNYENDIMKSFDLLINQAQAKLNMHPIKLESFRGRIHGEDSVLNTENFEGKLGNSDFKLSMKYHYGKKNKGKENFFNLKSNRLDIDQLTNYQPPTTTASGDTNHDAAFNIFEIPFSNTKINIDIGSVNYHKVLIQNVKGRLRLKENHFLYIDTMAMDVAGGHIDLGGYFNGNNPSEIYFSPNFYVKNINLDQLLIKFDNLGQDYLINDNINGRITGSIKGKLKMHPDLVPIINASELDMDLMIKDGALIKFAPLLMMGDYFKDKNLNIVRFDTLQNVFKLKNNTLHIPKMNINSSLGFMEISGTQSLDKDMTYFLRIPWSLVTGVGVHKLFGGKKKEDIDPEREDAIVFRDRDKRVRFINIKVTGNTDNYKITLGRDRNPI